MNTQARRRRLSAAGFVALGVALLVAGSFLYWVGEGRPRSPKAFRALVEDSGLVVEWSNNGPRGGEGVVATACGEQMVSVQELDGVLWVTWANGRRPITAAIIDQILACATTATGSSSSG